jgi:excisionase family DNA binding protein
MSYFKYQIPINPDGTLQRDSRGQTVLQSIPYDSCFPVVEPGTSVKDNKRPEPDPCPDGYYKIGYASKLSGYHRDTLKKYCRNGQLVYARNGKHWLIQRESLETFLKRSAVSQKRGRGRIGRPRILED